MIINDLKHVLPEDDKRKILRRVYYEYIWSFQRLTNSEIKDSLYPENYIKAIKKELNAGNTPIIDVEDENIIGKINYETGDSVYTLTS